MTTKHLSLRFSADDFSWITRKAASLGMSRDEYVTELIKRARALDGLGGQEIRHLDGDPRNSDPDNLELRESER